MYLYTRAQLLTPCQQNVVHDQMDHHVNGITYLKSDVPIPAGGTHKSFTPLVDTGNSVLLIMKSGDYHISKAESPCRSEPRPGLTMHDAPSHPTSSLIILLASGCRWAASKSHLHKLTSHIKGIMGLVLRLCTPWLELLLLTTMYARWTP